MAVSNFASTWQEILNLGLVDPRYPMEHACVHLPNGWYGINCIISGLYSILNSYEYDELQLPTISTKAIFADIPNELKGNIDDRTLQITHTGIHKLDDPYYLSSRPDFVIPQIVKINARSYRDLPVRRVMRGFRYYTPSTSLSVSLVTDSEITALDAEGIFASEEEYNHEHQIVLSELEKFLKDKLKLSTFTVISGISRIFFSILPDGSVIEVARIRRFEQVLATAIDFKVLQPTNRREPPFIFNLTVNSTLFAAVVAAHSQPTKVVLPMYTLRSFGTSYGVDIPGLTQIRLDVSRLPFTQERFTKLLQEGGLFALLPGAEGKIQLLTANGSEILEISTVESRVLELLTIQEQSLEEAEKAAFNARLQEFVVFIPKNQPTPEGLTRLGSKVDDPDVYVAAKTFLPIPI